MKIKRLRKLSPAALTAVGVFLGRGAQADTILDFNTVPSDQPVNCQTCPGINQSFGDNAGVSSDGVTVMGFGTPNIGLSWGVLGTLTQYTIWDYYNDGSFWMAAQIQDSYAGNSHTLTFTPNNASVQAVIKSFNFFPYYNGPTCSFCNGSTERFTYSVSVRDGATVVSGPTTLSFLSDGTKNHPVSINYTGTAGHALELRITRVASTLGAGEIEGDGFNIAVDDITFAQLPASVLPAGPQVVSVTPTNNQAGVPAVYYPYLASITNGNTTLVAGTIQLKLDGTLVSPPPTISSSGGLTNVSYPGTSLLSSGTHRYRLTYGDNLGSTYANEVQFTTTYSTLPTSYGARLGSGSHPGFTYRSVSASTEATNLAGSVARAVAQLNGTLINTNTSLPYTNSATPGTNADGSYNIDTVLNFRDTQSGGLDNFPNEELFPGLDAGPYDWFSTEARLFLELPAGYYRFGVNSDDGFEVNALPLQGVPGGPIVLGIKDSNGGVADVLFDFLVQASGTYPFQVIYFESDGWASCEFFSVTNFATGDKVLINDTSDGNAVKSYRALPPRITSAVKNGSNVDIQWAYGTAPFQVQFKSTVNGSWNNSGGTTTSRTASVPFQPSTGFIRVLGSP